MLAEYPRRFDQSPYIIYATPYQSLYNRQRIAYKVLAIDNEILLQNIKKDAVLGELPPKPSIAQNGVAALRQLGAQNFWPSTVFKLADRDVDHLGMLITHKSQHSHIKHVFIFLT